MRKPIVKMISKIHEITTQNLKVDSVKIDSATGVSYLLISIQGKSSGVIRREPLDLIKENSLLTSFSKDDFDLVIDTLLKNQKRLIEDKYRPELALVRHQYSDQLNAPLLVYKEIKKNQLYIKPAQEVYADLSLMRRFSATDAVCIGHIVGSFENDFAEQK